VQRTAKDARPAPAAVLKTCTQMTIRHELVCRDRLAQAMPSIDYGADPGADGRSAERCEPVSLRRPRKRQAMVARICKTIAMTGIIAVLLPTALFAQTYRGTLRCNSGFTSVTIVKLDFYCSDAPCVATPACPGGIRLCPGLVTTFTPSGFSCSSALDPDVIGNFILTSSCNYSVSCLDAHITVTCKRWVEIDYECSLYPGVIKTVCMRVPGSASLTCTPSSPDKLAGDGDATITIEEVLPEAVVASSCMPPPGIYDGQAPGSFVGGLTLDQMQFQGFAPCVAPPPAAPGPPITTIHNALFSGVTWIGGVPFPFTAPVTCTIASQFSSAGGGIDFFETELVSLSLLGAPLPGGVLVRESPTRPSEGWTTMRADAGGDRATSHMNVYLDISRDGGVTWVPATDLTGSPTNVRFLLRGTSTDVTAAVPKVTLLYPCVPNPFNPTTTIEFDLAHDGYVQLRVLDVSGRAVRMLMTPAGCR